LAQADRLGPKVGGHLALHATFVRWTGWTLAVAVHCYDDSTINIVVDITITITSVPLDILMMCSDAGRVDCVRWVYVVYIPLDAAIHLMTAPTLPSVSVSQIIK